METSNASDKGATATSPLTPAAFVSPVQEALEPIHYGQGWALYAAESFLQRQARDSSGKFHNARMYMMQDWNVMTPWQRNETYKLQDDIFAIVTQRAQILGGMEWSIKPSRALEDEVAEKLKEHVFILDQIGEPDQFDIWTRARQVKLRKELFSYLGFFELKQDMSNFDACLRMWKKSLSWRINTSASEIEDWLNKAHKYHRVDDEGELVECVTMGFGALTVARTIDFLVHGTAAVQPANEKFDGLYLLPGGSVYRIPGPRVGQQEFYVQLMYGTQGYGYQEPVWFYPDQISMAYYIPSSSYVNGFRPIDAIMIEIATAFNYSNLLNRYSNNEMPPEKVIFVVDENLAASPSNTASFPQNDVAGAERKEEVLNSHQRDKNVRVFPERGKDVKMFDLSKQDWLAALAENRERIRRVAARVYGATPNEMGETNTGMIAKAGAEAQAELYNMQSIKPSAVSWEHQLTHELLNKRFGEIQGLYGRPIMWEHKFRASETDMERYAKAEAAMKTPMAKNEIRERILLLDATLDPADDKVSPVQPQPSNQDLMSAIANKR